MVAGYGLTYLTGVGLLFEERIAFGAVLGAMAVASISFLLSLAARDVTAATVLAALALALLVAAGSIVRHYAEVRAELAEARGRWLASPRTPGHPWPFGAVVLV